MKFPVWALTGCFAVVTTGNAFFFSFFLKIDCVVLQILLCMVLSHSSQIAQNIFSYSCHGYDAGLSRLLNQRKALTMKLGLSEAMKVDESLGNPTAHNRIARNVHPCISKIVREYDWCRDKWIAKVQCKRRHPACSHVIHKHRIPKCHTVYGFRNATFVNKCSALPIDCQCAS